MISRGSTRMVAGRSRRTTPEMSITGCHGCPNGKCHSLEWSRAQGKKEIEKSLTQLFEENKNFNLEISEVTREFIGKNVVIVDGVWEVSGVGKGTPTRGRSTVVRVKRKDRWVTIAHRSMVRASPVIE